MEGAVSGAERAAGEVHPNGKTRWRSATRQKHCHAELLIHSSFSLNRPRSGHPRMPATASVQLTVGSAVLLLWPLQLSYLLFM
jgi:hypothetical protein